MDGSFRIGFGKGVVRLYHVFSNVFDVFFSGFGIFFSGMQSFWMITEDVPNDDVLQGPAGKLTI